MTQIREKREIGSREKAERPKRWMPPQLLPDPNPEPGYAFRWVRLSTLNSPDATNISSKFREGWEPVKASEHPEVVLLGNQEGRFKDSIEIGGLLLCKTPSEMVGQRNEFYQKQTDAQMQSVDNNFMRENDSRMPLFKDRQSKVTFGRGSS